MRKHFSHITCHKQTWQIKCIYIQKHKYKPASSENCLAEAYLVATQNKNMLDGKMRIRAYIVFKNVSKKIQKIKPYVRNI